MSSSNAREPIPFAALSVVKHGYVARGIASHPGFRIAVVADDPDVPDWTHQRNQKFADEFRVPYVRDVERALKEYGVRVAVVSTEAERHCDVSIRAANLGMHVVQDKPMSTRLSECDRLVEAIERNRVKFLLWNRNYLPSVIQAREAVESGAIGRLNAIHADFYFSKDAGPPKGTRTPDAPPMNWQEYQIAAHADGSDGGLGRDPVGELLTEGIYPLAYVHLLSGAKVRRVFARTGIHFHQVNQDNGVEDLASVTLEMEGGLVGTLALGRIGVASHPDIGEIKLCLLGSEGALVVNEARPEVGVYYRGQPPKEFRHRRVANENDYLLADNFLRAIENDEPTILDARAGRAISATVFAALESARLGRPVDVS